MVDFNNARLGPTFVRSRMCGLTSRLNEQDVGTIIVRSRPRLVSHNNSLSSQMKDWSDVPYDSTEKAIAEVGKWLLSVNPKELEVKSPSGDIQKVENDGYWVRQREFKVSSDSNFGYGADYAFIRNVFSGISQILTDSDTGKQIVRVQPKPLPYGNYDWSFVPRGASPKEVNEAAKLLLSVDEKKLEMQCGEEILTEPNDGSWVTVDYFSQFLQEHPDTMYPSEITCFLPG